MIKGPKISIITACYNAEKTIEQTIQSVLAQTYDHIEYIIVDGASTDSTMDIVNKYRDRIDIIISESDKGIYDAFNKGIKVTTGEYVNFMNADDYFYAENSVRSIVDEMSKYSNVAMIYGDTLCYDEQTGYINPFCRTITYEDLIKGGSIIHQANFTKREYLIEQGMFNLKYRVVADVDLTVKIFKKYDKFVYRMPKFVCVFRAGGFSADYKNIEVVYKEKQQILKEYFGVTNFIKEELSNEKVIKYWLEKKVFSLQDNSHFLLKKNIYKVAIWGTGIVANLLATELKSANIEIVTFIDNDINKQHLKMNNTLINAPSWLVENYRQLDALIFGFEGNHTEAVTNQLKSLNIEIRTIHWKEIVLS